MPPWHGAAALVLAVFAALWAAACAQFGVPLLPELPPAGATAPGTLYVVYHPRTVLGFGHTGLIVPAEQPGVWLRFDQYASAELIYGRRVAAGEAGFWEGLTARLPSIFGLTRETVTRRAAASPEALRSPGERLLPIAGLDSAAVRAAAEQRYATAYAPELESARRYVWTANNCQTFLRDVLRAGGPIHERYFPKHFVEDYLAEPRPPRAESGVRPAPTGP